MKSTERVLLAPGVPDLHALGAQNPGELLSQRPLPGADRLESSARFERLRLPLPGTPDASGKRRGKPRGAGTGWVELARWRAPSLGECVTARFTRPRSQSLAERTWNVLCGLRHAGVGTPEPLAVGARGPGLFARESFLVTRALDDFEPLDVWIRRVTSPRLVRRCGTALAILLRNLARSGLWLPRLRLADLAVNTIGCGSVGSACDLRPPPVPLAQRRLPGVVVTRFDGARTTEEPDAVALLELLRRLRSELPRDVAELWQRELRRVAARATRDLSRPERQRVLRALA